MTSDRSRSFSSVPCLTDRVQSLETAEVNPPVGDRGRGGGLIRQLVDRQQLEFGPGRDDADCAVPCRAVNFAVGIDRTGAVPDSVQTLLMFSDDIARAIINTAVERGITLIVLGLTGKNVFARLLAGNVPVELIKNTKIPVLLFPPDFKGSI